MSQQIRKDQTNFITEHDISDFTEYPFTSGGLSLGISSVRGRYPAGGWDVDNGIEQIWYVMKGSATVEAGDKTYELAEGDMLHIDKGERFSINGTITIMVASSPAWTDEQHLHVN